ncbi:hypothetical protein BDA99DRAFT_543768 [Phascolomyces articulosus]|uniref:F-box domain-containing protein n=1 Tax=Phascolomyces articulosus TaxID=60185 RepID=A0AAD5P7C6_9FUNG|nr:hypothetical protein BDA99DRAFT_543768 [Phascolomyces articulosus]
MFLNHTVFLVAQIHFHFNAARFVRSGSNCEFWLIFSLIDHFNFEWPNSISIAVLSNAKAKKIPMPVDSKTIVIMESNNKETTKNHELFNILPFDILVNIFGHFTQVECIQCMVVCKTWYKKIPFYTQQVWLNITIDGTPAYQYSRTWLQFTGEHVKSFTFHGFQEMNLYPVMQQLIDHGCVKLQCLSFEECTIPQQAIFLPLLSQIACHVKYLSMLFHLSNVSFLGIMRSCPIITRFIFKPTAQAYNIHDICVKEPLLIEYNNNNNDDYDLHHPPKLPRKLNLLPNNTITEICLDVLLDKQIRLEPILQECPNLQYLICANHSTDGVYHPNTRIHRSMALDLDLIFFWCPKLKYLETNNYGLKEEGNNRARETITDNGLKCLIVCESDYFGPQQIGPRILHNAHSLKYLIICKPPLIEHQAGTIPANKDWSSVLQALHAPHLQTLELDGILYDKDALLNATRQCTVLETLIVH